jgi:hypothetical protein
MKPNVGPNAQFHARSTEISCHRGNVWPSESKQAISPALDRDMIAPGTAAGLNHLRSWSGVELPIFASTRCKSSFGARRELRLQPIDELARRIVADRFRVCRTLPCDVILLCKI